MEELDAEPQPQSQPRPPMDIIEGESEVLPTDSPQGENKSEDRVDSGGSTDGLGFDNLATALAPVTGAVDSPSGPTDTASSGSRKRKAIDTLEAHTEAVEYPGSAKKPNKLRPQQPKTVAQAMRAVAECPGTPPLERQQGLLNPMQVYVQSQAGTCKARNLCFAWNYVYYEVSFPLDAGKQLAKVHPERQGGLDIFWDWAALVRFLVAVDRLGAGGSTRDQ